MKAKCDLILLIKLFSFFYDIEEMDENGSVWSRTPTEYHFRVFNTNSCSLCKENLYILLGTN